MNNKTIMVFLYTTALLFGLAACEEEGPAERFGERLDDAAYEAQQAAENAADSLDSAATDAANAVEDACEEVSDQNC